MRTPIIYIPGLPGSHLHDTDTGKRIFLTLTLKSPRLQGPEDLTAADPVRAGNPIRRAARILLFDIAKQAGSLYDILRKLKVEIVSFGWDWRRPVYDDAKAFSVRRRLGEMLKKAHDDSGIKPVVIVHSTGGLVLRSCLEARPQLARRIDKVIAFGVPWAGTPQSMLYVNGQSGFAGIVSRRKAQRLLVHSWAGWDLFPPDPTHLEDSRGRPLNLAFRRGTTGKEQVNPLADLDWVNSLPDALQEPARRRAAAAHAHLGQRRPTLDLGGEALEVVNVVGWGFETPAEAELAGTGAAARMTVRELKGDATLDGGDGTVPRVSAAWLRGGGAVSVRTYHVPVGRTPGSRIHVHKALWRNPGGRNLLAHLLRGDDLRPFCYAALDRDDTVQAGPAELRLRLVALDADGEPLPGAVVRTVNLAGPGGQIEEGFAGQHDGRHLTRLPRARIRRVGAGSQLRRLEVKIGWLEGGRRRWQRRALMFPA